MIRWLAAPVFLLGVAAFITGTLGAEPLTPAVAKQAGPSLVLHPSGFGPHSYSAWKAQEGQPDTNGSKNQALYFQKQTTTPTFAAGVAIIKGLEGLPADSLTGLSWDHRTDGHCGAGAPRWNIYLEEANGNQSTVFLGCTAAAHTNVNGTWCRDTQTIPNMPAGAVIRGLAIVFDEGTDVPNNPTPLCTSSPPLPSGFVYLDNITVAVNGTPHVWTSASDNGNGQTIESAPATASFIEGTLGMPVTALFP